MTTWVRFLPEHPRLRMVLTWALTLVAIVAGGWALAAIGAVVAPVVIPLAVAVLLTGLLMPVQVLVNRRLGMPRTLGAALTLAIVALLALPALLVVGVIQMWLGGRAR